MLINVLTITTKGEFGDAFLEGTGLEGGSVPPSLAAFSLTLDRALREQRFFFNDFSHEDMQHLEAINEIFKDAKNLGRKVLFLIHPQEGIYPSTISLI